MEGIKELLVEDNLQKGKIISFPFLNGYTEVLCMVGGIRGIFINYILKKFKFPSVPFQR